MQILNETPVVGGVSMNELFILPIPQFTGSGIAVKILFVRNEQKDCNEKPELLLYKVSAADCPK